MGHSTVLFLRGKKLNTQMNLKHCMYFPSGPKRGYLHGTSAAMNNWSLDVTHSAELLDTNFPTVRAPCSAYQNDWPPYFMGL